MDVRLAINTKNADVEKLALLEAKLTALGVLQNGRIICKPEMDEQVFAIMEEVFLTKK